MLKDKTCVRLLRAAFQDLGLLVCNLRQGSSGQRRFERLDGGAEKARLLAREGTSGLGGSDSGVTDHDNRQRRVVR